MSIFSRFSDRLHYYLDYFRVSKLTIKIEYFKFEPKAIPMIRVHYRLGRQKLLDHLPILEFEHKYFRQVSDYDRQRLTKFSTL